MVPIFYSALRCPFATRARLALLWTGVRCELREVDLKDKPPELEALSAKATVPVLLLHDGQVLEESLDIMRWAAESRPQLRLWPDNPVRRQAVSNLIAAIDGPFAEASYRYRHAERFAERGRDDYRMEGEIFLAQLEARLARATHLVGDAETLADLAILPFVHQFVDVDPAWFAASPYQRLAQWLAQYRAHPLFAAAHIPHPRWTPDSATVYLSPAH